MKKVIVQAARRKPHCSPARLCILPAAGNSIYEPLSGCIGTPSWSSQLFELTRNDVKGTEIRLNRQCSRSQESEDRSAIVYSKIDTSAPSSLRSHAPKPKKRGSRVTCTNGSDGYRYGTWYCTSSWKYSNVHGTRCFLNIVNQGTDIFVMIGVQPASTSFGRQPRLASKLDDLHFLKFLRKVTPL